MSNYRTYFADDANYEADLQAAYEVIGLPEWWNDTEQDDIKLVALYRAKLIEKLEADLNGKQNFIIEAYQVLQKAASCLTDT